MISHKWFVLVSMLLMMTISCRQKTARVELPLGSWGRSATHNAFIDRWLDTVLTESARTGIPASIKMAQGILESGAGKSRLSREANNYFGITCGNWNKERYQAGNVCYRSYTNPIDSWRDHSQILQTKRFRPLFTIPVSDYKRWAVKIYELKYASDPEYPMKLINLIDNYQLYLLDNKKGLSWNPR